MVVIGNFIRGRIAPSATGTAVFLDKCLSSPTAHIPLL